MKLQNLQFITLSVLLSVSATAAELGTRQRTVQPVALSLETPLIYPSDVAAYDLYGYSWWQWGPGVDAGRQFLAPAGPPGAPNAARLLSFLSLSDIHLVDKESPAQAICTSYLGGLGGTPATYSPVMLYTTQVLDAALRTANAVHRLTPFDFAVSLGDDCNGPQYNEHRWFIDIMDGKYITPSSGAHVGATNIDYQMPFQAVGLDPSIPWYAAIGNHDHFWLGGVPLTPALADIFTNQDILLLQPLNEFAGAIDGTTPFGYIMGVGPVADFVSGGVTNTPTVIADTNRLALTRSTWMREFFNTSSKPVGHGYTEANVTNDFACYSFMPVADIPIKVIVLDDTMTDEDYDSKGQGGLDTRHLNWLTNELQLGQNEGQLMIIAAHVQLDLLGLPGTTNSIISETNLLATLHTYPNLILWMCGHVHRNNVIPQPSPDISHPEYGFWEVETASLRDFPQEFRTFEILRNTDNSISIRVTDVDPEVTPGSPADISRGYAIGASRIFQNPNEPSTSVTDTNSYAYNAELIKQLSPAMQQKIAHYGKPLGHPVAVDRLGTNVVVNFLGELQSADSILGPWTNAATNSPYAASATNVAKFYRAVE